MQDSYKKFGSGMTEYTVQHSETEPPNYAEEIYRTTRFPYISNEIFEWCMERIPEEAKLNDEIVLDEDDHSEGGYAQRILMVNFEAKVAYDHQQYDDALCHMLAIGMLIAEAKTKFEWESFALTGKKFFENNGVGNEPKKKEARKREEIINKRAAEIAKTNSHWSKTRIAEQIEEELEKLGITEKLSVHTIRQKIKLS